MNDYKWSIKKILKEIVLSATYMQAASLNKEMLEKDPNNRYYERSSRVRLSAEQIRDQALSVSGLLDEKMYGPSVMPWQPEGIWMSPWNGDYWKLGTGGDQHRRALYTFWKRTAPYPSMITFDAVGREVCTARRIITNTPLQALVTLNDSVYLEAARYYAYRMQNSIRTNNIPEIISNGYSNLLFKSIAPAKLNALLKLYNNAFDRFKNNADKTCAIVGVNNKYNNPETAALVIVANALLNLE